MELFIIQILGSLGSFTLLVLSGTIPFCFIRCKRGKGSGGKGHRADSDEPSVLLSLCNCFACGVFISTCFLSLIPHVKEHVKLLRTMRIQKGSNGSTVAQFEHDSPFLRLMNGKETEMMVLLGFFMILLAEQLVGGCQQCTKGGHKVQNTHRRIYEMDSKVSGGVEFEPLVVEKSNDTAIFHDEVVESDQDSSPSINSGPSGSRKKHGHQSSNGHRQHDHLASSHQDHGAHCPHHQMEMDVAMTVASKNSKGLTFRAIALLIGMGVHTIFEGLALGLQDTEETFTHLLIGVLLHEVLCVLAFALTLAQQDAPLGSGMLAIVIMSITIPLGMLVGFAVPKQVTVGALLMRLTLEGLAAGTFVYVACVEMLGAEMSVVSSAEGLAKSGVVKAIFVILGFGTFLAVLALTSGHHHH